LGPFHPNTRPPSTGSSLPAPCPPLLFAVLIPQFPLVASSSSSDTVSPEFFPPVPFPLGRSFLQSGEPSLAEPILSELGVPPRLLFEVPLTERLQLNPFSFNPPLFPDISIFQCFQSSSSFSSNGGNSEETVSAPIELLLIVISSAVRSVDAGRANSTVRIFGLETYFPHVRPPPTRPPFYFKTDQNRGI